jgi:hypothetical protein
MIYKSKIKKVPNRINSMNLKSVNRKVIQAKLQTETHPPFSGKDPNRP